jgi:glycerophosphoryl diester phosphodiesterase
MCLTSSVADAQLIVAHRGASHDAPENTLAAFRLAWQQQADAIEGDFYLTSDNQIVCIHDRTTKRTAPGQAELSVAKSTFEELRQLDVGSWKGTQFADERIPTLKEVLATVPAGRQIFVEVKCGPEIIPILKPQLESSGLADEQIVIICFNQAVVTQSRQVMPQYKVNWLTSYKQKTEQSEWKPTADEVLATLRRTGATGLGTHGNLKVIDQTFADAVQQAGIEFHVWTINDADTARAFAAFGPQSLTTDRPAFIRKAITDSSATDR